MTEQMQEQPTPEIPEAPKEVKKPRRRLSIQTRKMLGVLRQLRKGTSTVPACQSAHIDPTTFYRWKKRYPRFAELAEGIISGRISVVEDALFQACFQDRNISAIIFFLTNRAGDKWADKRAIFKNTNIFSPQAEVKNGEVGSIESTLARIDKIRASLIPPGDPK